MKMYRNISAILSIVTLLTAVSCGGGTDTNETSAMETSASDSTAAPEDETDRASIADNLPEGNFGGRDFNILSYSLDDKIYGGEEATGDVVDDAVYARRKNVEERFNVILREINIGNHRETGAEIERSVLAGDDEYDLYSGQAMVSGGSAVKGIFLNWYDVPRVDFTKPWWQKKSVEALSVDGVMLLVPSYMTMNVIGYTYCMFYNKEIADNYKLDDIYEVVASGNWTFDRLNKTVADIYSDLNGNGKPDEGDLFGMGVSPNSPAITFEWAFDMKFIERDAGGKLNVVLGSQRNSDIYDRLYDFFYKTEGVSVSLDKQSIAMTELFATGNYLLTPGFIGSAVSILRDFDTDYAIIPYPKYDAEQAEYLTMIDGGHSVIAVPKTAKSPEESGIITEIMTAESWKNVIPSYYDVALKFKGTRDVESVEMLDMILDSVKVDFTYVYDNWQGYAFFLQELLKAKNENFISYVDSNKSAKLAYYESIYQAFYEYVKK